MIYVVATTKVKPEHRAAYVEGAKDCVAETRKEPGCIAYDQPWQRDPIRIRSCSSSAGKPRSSRRASQSAASESRGARCPARSRRRRRNIEVIIGGERHQKLTS
jgi:hypothetical protein